MQALVFTAIVGVLLVGLFSVSAALDEAKTQWKAQQQQYERAGQALVMLVELHVQIGELVEILAIDGRDSDLMNLAWELMERHKAACEFARGKHV